MPSIHAPNRTQHDDAMRMQANAELISVERDDLGVMVRYTEPDGRLVTSTFLTNTELAILLATNTGARPADSPSLFA